MCKLVIRIMAVIILVLFPVSALYSAEKTDGYYLPFEATGKEFILEDNPISPLKITSSEEVHIVIEAAITNCISFHIEPISTTTKKQAVINIWGLKPFYPNPDKNKPLTLYRHGDGHFQKEFSINNNDKHTYTQDISKKHHICILPGKTTVYLSGNPGDVIYLRDLGLGTEITEPIVVESDGIIVDGSGTVINGQGWGYGIYLNSRTGVTIRNCTVQYFNDGIYLTNSPNNIITDNIVRFNYDNIWLIYSPDNLITRNTYIASGNYGIMIYYSSRGTVTNNSGTSNLIGICLHYSSNNTVTNNILNENGAAIWLVGSNYNLIRDNTVNASKWYGFLLEDSTIDNRIYHNNIYGSYIYNVYARQPIELSYFNPVTLRNEGNWWGRVTFPLFIPGIDSNAANVVDSAPYGVKDAWNYIPPIPPRVIIFPTVSTNLATDITYNSATLNGTVNPNGFDTGAYFEWGETILYGNSTLFQSIGSGILNVYVTADLSGLSPNTTYNYRIVASNFAGTAYGLNQAFTTLLPPLPEQVTSPEPIDGAINVITTPILSWAVASGATSYDIYFGTTLVLLFVTNTTETNYNPGTLNYNTTYYWRIDSRNNYGTTTGNIWRFTTQTAPVIIPNAPSNLVATAVSSSQINLFWQDNSDNEDGFILERHSSLYTHIAMLPPNTTTYFDIGLHPHTTYTYRVKAFNAAGGSHYSNEASATTHPEPIAHTLGTTAPCDAVAPKEPGDSTIDYASGNLNLAIDIMRIIPTTALDTNLTLYYNSRDDIAGGLLGPKWTHTFNQSIIGNPDGTLSYRMGDGKRFIYQDPDGDRVYNSLSQYGSYSTITKNPDNTYSLVRKDRTAFLFDIAGRLVQIQDRNNNRVTCQYTNGNLTEITLPNYQKILISYFPNNIISSIADPAGNTTDLFYNATGQLSSISKDSGSWQWQFGYQPGTNLISTLTNPRGFQTQYRYEIGTNKIAGIIDANNNPKTFSYDVVNSVATITDRNGKSTTAKYNLALDTWSERTDPLGNTTINTIDNNRNLLARTKPNNAVTRYTYDSRGNILTVTDPLFCTTTYRYEDPNNPDFPTLITDARNVSTYLEYANRGNLTRRVEGLGTSAEQRTNYEYYNNGKLKKETRDPSHGINLVTEYIYNANGYLAEKIIDPGTTPALNIVYKTDYTVLGQVWKSYCPRSLQLHFQYTYDYRGNRTEINNVYTGTITKLEYDLMDNLTRRTEDLGGLNIVIEYQYDNLGRLTLTILDPWGLNIQTATEYDAVGRVTKTTDPEGATTEYFYYDNGWLKSTTRQLTPLLYAISQYFYDANGNRIRVVDPEGHETLYIYTVLNQLATTTDAKGNVTQYNYNEVGLTNWVQDARGNKTYTFYDQLRRIKYVRTPQDNITTAYVYDKAGRTTQVIGPWYDTNQNGEVDTGESRHPTYYILPTIYYSEYDNADRVIRTWVNSHPATQYEYDKAGNQTRITDPESGITERTYDRCHQLTLTKVDPTGLNEQTKYIYDKLGRQIQLTVATGTALATTTYSEYDNANRLIRQYTAVPVYATNYQYNKRGQQTQVTDAELRSTLYAYDLGDRLIRTTDARGYNTDYAYDLDGNRIKVTYYHSGIAIDTFYTYYKNHFLKTTNYPGFNEQRNITTNYYDGNGNLTSKIDAKGQTINYTYDKNNRLTLKAYPDISTMAYSYDASSNLLTTLDSNTDTVNDYDDLSRLTKITNRKYTPNKVIEYTYYEGGLRKSMTEPEGGLVEYGYDKAKRLTSVKRNSIIEGSYEYNALGLRTNLTYGNGAYAEYQYNHPLKWLTALYNKKSDNSILSSFIYTLDKVGNRTTMTLTNGDVVTYGYDETYQLLSELRTGATPYSISWTYDEVGNRLTQNKNGVLTTYLYNDANQLISEISGGVTTTYEYDSNGNQIKKTKGTEISVWNYDYENRQISYSDPLNSGLYVYDAEERRIKHNSVITAFRSKGNQNAYEKIGVGNGKGKGREQGQGTQNAINNVAPQVITTIEQYIYDGANIIADYDGANNLKASYVTPFLDQNLLLISGTNTYYYFQDGLGSVRNLLDASQNIKNTYDYYAFGEILSETETIPNRYKFTSREWDAESQTNYYRARYQDPRTGRFLSADPIGYLAGINLYSYVGNNLVNYTDPFGLLGEIMTAGRCGENDVCCLKYYIRKEDFPSNEACLKHMQDILADAKKCNAILLKWRLLIAGQPAADVTNIPAAFADATEACSDAIKIAKAFNNPNRAQELCDRKICTLTASPTPVYETRYRKMTWLEELVWELKQLYKVLFTSDYCVPAVKPKVKEEVLVGHECPGAEHR